MPLTLREGATTEGLPTVKLGSQNYFIAPLLLREIIANAALAGRTYATMRKIAASLRPAPGGEEHSLVELEETELYLLADFVRNGLRRLYPSATRDDILDRPITIMELVVASSVITGQSGGVQIEDAGETPAASDLKTSTGNA